jgi:hypothetical protein
VILRCRAVISKPREDYLSFVDVFTEVLGGPTAKARLAAEETKAVEDLE